MTDAPYLTPDHILLSPNFAAARDQHICAVLELYEFKPSLIELMLDGGRIMVYATVMALWGRYQEEDLTTLPTMSLLKKTVGLFEVASPRQVDLIVARFVQVGHLQIRPAPNDLRMRIALPTDALIEHDRAFIAAHYSALRQLVGEDAYALPLSRDITFLKAMRGAWISTFERMAKEIFSASPAVLRFYAASAGMLMLMKLVQLQHLSPDAWLSIDYTDFGRRFGVSRTHVRTLLKTAAAGGDIELDARGRLRLQPELLAAFDRNLAERMSLLDLAHGSAVTKLDGRLPAN